MRGCWDDGQSKSNTGGACRSDIERQHCDLYPSQHVRNALIVVVLMQIQDVGTCVVRFLLEIQLNHEKGARAIDAALFHEVKSDT